MIEVVNSRVKVVEDEFSSVLAECEICEDGVTKFIICEWINEADDLLTIEITKESLLDYLAFEDDDDERAMRIRSEGIEYVIELGEEPEDLEYPKGMEYMDICEKLVSEVLDRIEYEPE